MTVQQKAKVYFSFSFYVSERVQHAVCILSSVFSLIWSGAAEMVHVLFIKQCPTFTANGKNVCNKFK